jgi:hypothetical protein
VENFDDLSNDRLKILIENHRRASRAADPKCIEAMEELDRRLGKGLEFKHSFEVIRTAARAGRFVSYKELADASGADWNRVYRHLGSHLWRLVEYAHFKDWPMLSAVVVNKQHRETGRMEPETLKGFIAAARDLGHEIDDAEMFLRDQQQAVFAWAKDADQEAPPAN